MNADRRRRLHVLCWRIINPPSRPLAGFVPWWVLLETTGNRTGRLRRTPLAAGPRDADGMWLNVVHGHHAAWVRNIQSVGAVRVRVGRQWRTGTATVHPFDPAREATFTLYARLGPRTFGLDPLHVRVAWAT